MPCAGTLQHPLLASPGKPRCINTVVPKRSQKIRYFKGLGGLHSHLSTSGNRTLRPSQPVGRAALAVGVGVAAAGAVAALLNRWLGRRSERRHPPSG
jgi:hypothetical protein